MTATNPAFIPLGVRLIPNFAQKILSPACGGRGSHEKNARIFFMGTREGGRRPEGGIKTQRLPRLAANPAFIPLGANPAFIPLGGKPSIHPAWRKPNIHPAWRQTQHLPRLAANPAFIPPGACPGRSTH